MPISYHFFRSSPASSLFQISPPGPHPALGPVRVDRAWAVRPASGVDVRRTAGLRRECDLRSVWTRLSLLQPKERVLAVPGAGWKATALALGETHGLALRIARAGGLQAYGERPVQGLACRLGVWQTCRGKNGFVFGQGDTLVQWVLVDCPSRGSLPGRSPYFHAHPTGRQGDKTSTHNDICFFSFSLCHNESRPGVCG